MTTYASSTTTHTTNHPSYLQSTSSTTAFATKIESLPHQISPISTLTTSCTRSLPRMATRSTPPSSSTSRLDASLPVACASLLSLRNAPTSSPTSLPFSNHIISPISVIGQRNLSTNVVKPEILTTTITSITSPNTNKTGLVTSSTPKPTVSRFWETVLAETPSPITPPVSSTTPSSEYSASLQKDIKTNNQHNIIPRSRARQTLFATTDNDESSKMNILCDLCGVRFRKPGHLNMHWRSVHATSSDSIYPGKFQHLKEITPIRRGQQSTISAPLSSNGYTNSIDGGVNRKDRDIGKSGRAYGCPQCEARFRRGSDRNRHMRMVHAKIRPFECKICGNHFGRKSFLEAHILTVHQKLRPFRCECGAAFGQRSSLTRHTRKIHGREPQVNR